MSSICSEANTTVRNIRLPCGEQVTVVVRKKSTGRLRRRVLDDEGFIRRVASVCVNEDESKVLLITSKKDSTVWSIPGGGIEATEKECEAATREAWEEAGVRGQVGRNLGQFEEPSASAVNNHEQLRPRWSPRPAQQPQNVPVSPSAKFGNYPITSPSGQLLPRVPVPRLRLKVLLINCQPSSNSVLCSGRLVKIQPFPEPEYIYNCIFKYLTEDN